MGIAASTIQALAHSGYYDRASGFALDLSALPVSAEFFEHPRLSAAFAEMSDLVSGGVANPDEQRMVGHYWLRDPSLAPSLELRSAIEDTKGRILQFAADVHAGRIAPAAGERFTDLLVIGIGGSALGPQFVADALGGASDNIRPHFFDNTDPDGMVKALDGIPDLRRTLCLVISKSGGTKETRNGQLIAKQAWNRAGGSVARNFVAVTGEGSELDRTAQSEGWLARFPMWDWVGGRTSELSAVGLLPAALQGIDIEQLLIGARTMDRLTAVPDARRNPAALLALSWFQESAGRGARDMVVIPYKDRLQLFSRYLQQLVMESLGKELNRHGEVVCQGLAVYGNKGSTDQHAYVQQLREGVHNFFAVFIEVLKDRSSAAPKSDLFEFQVEPGVTSGDYLAGFLIGTRKALSEKGRSSITITVPEVSPATVGMLIALFERAVGIYASLIDVNAYHQPGVEAGKRAATEALSLQGKVLELLQRNRGAFLSSAEIAEQLSAPAEADTVFRLLRRLAAVGRVRSREGREPVADLYGIE